MSSATISHPLPLTIDEYLRKRLMPVEGVIPHLPGIDMYGNTIPAVVVGGDLFEYINFEQRYNIEARILQTGRLAKQYLDPLSPREPHPAMRFTCTSTGFPPKLPMLTRTHLNTERQKAQNNCGSRRICAN